jgi:hypothetical protein
VAFCCIAVDLTYLVVLEYVCLSEDFVCELHGLPWFALLCTWTLIRPDLSLVLGTYF